ncbi:TPA: LuxR C-terminal-related transcriptional regulator [Serratia fonticola]
MGNYKKGKEELNRVFAALRALSPPNATNNEKMWPKTREIAERCGINIYNSRYYLMMLVNEKKAAVSERSINNSKRWCIAEPIFSPCVVFPENLSISTSPSVELPSPNSDENVATQKVISKMKRPIIIAMHDSNIFFLQGMKHIFKMYFHNKRIAAVFSPTTETQYADIVVNRCVTSIPCEGVRQKITIRRRDFWGGSIYLQRSLSYYDKSEDVLHLLDELFNAYVNECTEKYTSNGNISIRISRREKEVLQQIITELPVARIAKKLQISVKTVSAHKHSAMRKLGFRNNQELYIWLLRMKNFGY